MMHLIKENKDVLSPKFIKLVHRKALIGFKADESHLISVTPSTADEAIKEVFLTLEEDLENHVDTNH